MGQTTTGIRTQIDSYLDQLSVEHLQAVLAFLANLSHQELENAYQEASQEYDPIWEITVVDGLSDETPTYFPSLLLGFAILAMQSINKL